MLPFVHLVLITFTNDFVLDKSPFFVVYGIAFGAHKIAAEPYKLSLYLFDLCIALYFISILRFVYIAELMRIAKEKFLINRV